jgi:hypothetical protein
VIGDESSARVHELRDVLARGNVAFRFYPCDSPEGQAALHRLGVSEPAGPVLSLSTGVVLVDPANAPNVDVRYRCEVAGGGGSGHLDQLLLRERDSGQTELVPAAGLFVLIGAQPFTGWLPEAIKRDPWGFVLTGSDTGQDWPLPRPPFLLETTTPGVFAVGDVRHGSNETRGLRRGRWLNRDPPHPRLPGPRAPRTRRSVNPGYKPGERFGTSFETHQRNAITSSDLDDATAQSDLICAPQRPGRHTTVTGPPRRSADASEADATEMLRFGTSRRWYAACSTRPVCTSSIVPGPRKRPTRVSKRPRVGRSDVLVSREGCTQRMGSDATTSMPGPGHAPSAR